jgi:hypothetical protein
MHEYIKKLSFSLCLIEQVIKDTKFQEGFKKLEMSLIDVASDFLIVSGDNISNEKRIKLRKILVQVVDLLDLAKVGKVVSIMNAEVIISAALRLIEEVDIHMHRTNSFSLPRFSLSEMSDKLLRDRAREDEQNKFLNSKFEKDGGEVFNFTKIPEINLSEPKMSEPGLNSLKDLQDSVIQNASTMKDVNDSTKVADKIDGPKFEWGNGQGKDEPLVYTFFGSEDKIIEDRKSKLLEILKVGGGVAIGEVTKHFPGLNVKTLQRDLLDLMREKKVIMLGKKRWAKYYLK